MNANPDSRRLDMPGLWVVVGLLLMLQVLLIGCDARDNRVTPVIRIDGRNMAEDGRLGREATSAAFEALDAGDTLQFQRQLELADSLRPGHPTLRFHLARAFVMNGDPAGAWTILEGLLQAGMRVRLGDAALNPLQGQAGYDALSAGMEALGEPQVDASVWLRGTDPDLQAEGIWKEGDRVLLGSVHQGRIVNGDGAEWAKTDGYSAMGLAGVENDAHSTTIWSAQTMTPEGGAPDSLVGLSRIVAYDLTGQVLASFAPEDSLDHWFGDLVVAPDGTVYVSDSRAPGIYRVADGVLEPLLVGDPFTSPQGLAWMDGALYVADYSSGIFRVDPARGVVTWLKTPDNTVLLGIDGLIADPERRRLLGIQNGTNPTRVVSIPIKGIRIGPVEWYDAGHPEHSDPTLGVVQNDTLFYVANSQWPLFAPGIDPERAALRVPPVILALPLAAGRPGDPMP